jgi:hypothetical protein
MPNAYSGGVLARALTLGRGFTLSVDLILAELRHILTVSSGQGPPDLIGSG